MFWQNIPLNLIRREYSYSFTHLHSFMLVNVKGYYVLLPQSPLLLLDLMLNVCACGGWNEFKKEKQSVVALQYCWSQKSVVHGGFVYGTAICSEYNIIPLAPIGVLAPGSAHAWPFAQPPIDTRGNFFRRTCLGVWLQKINFQAILSIT